MATHQWHRGRLRHVERWFVVLVVSVGVLLPALGVLWFMTVAIRNERLAVRQRLVAVYDNELALLQRELDRLWMIKQDRLAKLDTEAPASQIFANLVRSGLAHSAIVYGVDGRPCYPAAASPIHATELPQADRWQQAWSLEFERGDWTAAAAAYQQLAGETADRDLQGRALLAQARCLVKSGQTEMAFQIATGRLADPFFRAARDEEGNLLVLNALSLALQTCANPSSNEWQRILQRLVDLLNDYGTPEVPANQRLFLMEQLHSVNQSDAASFSTLEAERLAAACLDADLPRTTGLHPRSGDLPDVWQLASPDKQFVAIWLGDRLRAELETLLAGAVSVPNATITLSAPGRNPSEPTPVLESSAGAFLPEWKLGLSLSGADPFAEEAARRTELYLWGGILVVGAIAGLAGFVARYVSGQLQITRLKENLIAAVSHELKTPVAATRALAESLLEGRYRDAAQQQEYLQLILQENERLGRLIQDFLAFSRMEQNRQTFQLEKVRVETIVSAAVDAERMKLQSPGCDLTVEVETDLPPIAGDAEALTTVLTNLLDNAYKYGGAERKIQLCAYAADGQVVFEVQDNGAGLSRRDARKVFAPFYQLHHDAAESVGGCGLGLSIVKFVVEAHGGSVEVASRPGRGSRFTVRIPTARANTQPNADLPSNDRASATNA